MPKNLLIVESPAKAKTIEKYLGKDYKVMSSVGHIRKDTKVDPEHDFKVTYEIDPDHTKVVQELKKAAQAADTIWLATDEDREGESISWHLIEVLDLPKSTKRITFHEITESALKDAIKNPRKVDMDMVASQQARQTLDMLVGYDLSGVVRKKVPAAISAGRVQSPALRLIVEREREIEQFNQKSTFKVSGTFGQPEFTATMEDALPTQAAAQKLLESLQGAKFTVQATEQTEGKKHAPVPFATAALQIEANSKLGFAASTTMRAAQGLYQAGHITYHRTDSLNLSNQALGAIGRFIEQKYGANYLEVRKFKTKSAGAQEAHEAIRPTHIEVETAGKNEFEKKLYKLIRSRTLATQMTPARVAKTTITITPDTNPKLEFIAKGEVVIFDGFLRVYGYAKDSELPPLQQGDAVKMHEIIARQTFERPPARYTEGSLVKKLEELGIGRPSTYASIMSAIQNRGYAVKGESEGEDREAIELVLKNGGSASGGRVRPTGSTKARSPVTTGTTKRPQEASTAVLQRIVTEKSGASKGKLLPTPVGELVSDFLTDHFQQIVDYGFTAEVEQKLDRIAEQKLDKVKMLRDFYTPFSKDVKKSDQAERYNAAIALGQDPKTGKTIYAKIGKNGGFIQLGESEKESGEKPRFAPLPEGTTVKTVTLKQAREQLALPELPRSLGLAKDGTELIAASGPFGPYLKAGQYNVPLKSEDPYTVTLKTAEKLYQAKLDSIIADWGEIMIINGAYGPYVKGPGRRNNVKIPQELDPKKLTLEQAQQILKDRPKSSRHAPHRRRKTAKTTRKATKSTRKASSKATQKSTKKA